LICQKMPDYVGFNKILKITVRIGLPLSPHAVIDAPERVNLGTG